MQFPPNESLSELELRVWEAVLSATETNQDGIGIVIENSKTYFFTGSRYYFTLDPLHVFGEQSDISWELIASSQTDSEHANREIGSDSWGPTITYGPRLYRLTGGAAPTSYKEIVLKEIGLRVSLVTIESDGSATVKVFPGISEFKLENSKTKVIDFFKGRDISSGTFEICRISDVVIDLFLQLDKLPEFLSREGVDRLTRPGEYGATIDSNRLGYNAETSKVFFQFDMTQGPDFSEADLVTGLNYVLSFLFNKLDLYVKGSVPFDQFLSNLVNCPVEELVELLEGEGGLDPFLEDFEYGINHKSWVSPDFIQVNIIKPRNDPSFGKPTEDSSQLIQILETRENYAKTSFSSISIDAYLARLTSQSGDYEMVRKIY